MRLNLTIFLIFHFLTSPTKAKPKLTNIGIGIIAPLATGNTTSSERYRQAFEAALFYAIGETSNQLNSCGYKIQIHRGYYPASKPILAKKKAELFEKKNVWAIYGPRRSEDLLRTFLGLKNTLLVGPMAEAHAVHQKSPLLFSMYPKMGDLAELAVSNAVKKGYGKQYISIVDATCPACIDFKLSFKKTGIKKGFSEVHSINITKKLPETQKIIEQVKKLKPDFILLPNTSKISGYLVTKISKANRKIKFIGANGWGDMHYGFLTKFGIPSETRGFCVRAGLPYNKMKEKFNVFSLDYEWKQKNIGPNFTAYTAIHFIRTLTNSICRTKPKSKAQFNTSVLSLQKNHFLMPVSISILELRNGRLWFQKNSI